MKWIVALLTGALLITVWARMSANSDGPRVVTARRAAEASYGRTLRALERAEATYRERARADSLLPLLPATPGITVALSPLVPRATADSIEAALARELRAIRSVRARIGVFVIDGTYGRRATFGRMYAGPEREIYVGTDAVGPYCAIVRTGYTLRDTLTIPGFDYAPNGRWMRDRITPTVLGPCNFVARHGAPGPRIAQWLEGGAWRFADQSGPAAKSDSVRSLPRRWSRDDGTNEIRGCGGGRDELCRSLLLLERHAPGDGAAFDLSTLPVGNAPAMLLHEVELQFGTERFAAFWNSSADAETAFATAFGTDMISWTRQWTTSHYRVASIGPRIDAGNVLFSVAIAVLLAGIGVLVAARREA